MNALRTLFYRHVLAVLIGFLLGLAAAALPREVFIGHADALSRPTQFDMGTAVCFQSPQGLSCIRK